MKQILFIQTAFLGDVILATAAIQATKATHPTAAIDVLVKKGNESLLQNNPHIRTVYVLNKEGGKYKAIFSLVREFRRRQYDAIINFHRFGSSGLITALSGAQASYGFRKNPFSFFFTKRFEHGIGDGTHEIERNARLLAPIGVHDSGKPELFPNGSQRRKVQAYQHDPYFCMAPASVWFTKQLPKDKWVELIERKGPEATIYLLGAPGDHALCESIRTELPNHHIMNLAGELSLLESAALMEGAVRNYVNDSGPLHISSAMNAPVTAFFCSTIPEFGFGPVSDDAQVLEVSDLACKPCGLHGYKSCPEGHFKCSQIDLSEAR